jgi:hypothetical protein
VPFTTVRPTIEAQSYRQLSSRRRGGIDYKDSKFDGTYLGRRNKMNCSMPGRLSIALLPNCKKNLWPRAGKLIAKTQPLTEKLRHPSYKGLREDL